jgi:hyperosmotically inducible protein
MDNRIRNRKTSSVDNSSTRRTGKEEETTKVSSKLWNFSSGKAALALVFLLASFISLTAVQAKSNSQFAEKVRRTLVTLPYYTVFDNLAFRIENNGKVVLMGQVTRPRLRSDAENAVARLEEVDSIDNQVEVLPLSPNDDQIRLATYRAIYHDSVFTRYAIRLLPPIHIIVKDGNVTLIGAVASETDKNVANILANGVPGVFSVMNDLMVDHAKEVS